MKGCLVLTCLQNYLEGERRMSSNTSLTIWLLENSWTKHGTAIYWLGHYPSHFNNAQTGIMKLCLRMLMKQNLLCIQHSNTAACFFMNFCSLSVSFPFLAMPEIEYRILPMHTMLFCWTTAPLCDDLCVCVYRVKYWTQILTSASKIPYCWAIFLTLCSPEWEFQTKLWLEKLLWS